jgi:hypothetical protein
LGLGVVVVCLGVVEQVVGVGSGHSFAITGKAMLVFEPYGAGRHET